MIKKTASAASKLAREENSGINKLFFDHLGAAPDIMDQLDKKFVRKSLVKHGPDGSIDPVQMAVACGAYEVISYIRQRIELGKQGL